MNVATYRPPARSVVVAAMAAALTLAVGACRRSGDGSRPATLNQASSQVMGNTAGATGTPGQSDAAQRAAGAQASGPAAAASPPPVTSTPGTSGGSSGAAGAGY